MKSKTVSYSSVMKKAFPERHISKAEADAFGEAVQRFQEQAVAAGWTPEFVASLDKKGDAK